MITSLLRLLPLVLMVGGGMKMLSKSGRFVSATQQVLVQSEISDILRTIHLDAIEGPQAIPTPENFAEYLHRNMKTSGTKVNRDVALDLWQTAYQIENRQGRVYVKSAGPDRKFGTSDDIVSGTDVAVN